MNFDILDRIKQMKQKLLELKTAHMHGLGNFKVYKQTLTINKPSSWDNYWSGKLHIDIKRVDDTQYFPPLLSVAWNSISDVFNIDGVLNGNTFTITYDGFYPSGVDNTFYIIVYSSSPVSLSYRVSDLQGI